ncbi:DNA helicase UvrD [Candidatus Uhrbacteria bacterium]|nr:DNA helicase UvrD [Candidatus Uhrbacteria bacterium]
MRFITDLHIHSKFSRACSKNLTFSNLAAWARVKGIDILGTSDFTHPGWFAEIESRLEPAEPGLFRLKVEFAPEDGTGSYVQAPMVRAGRPIRFILTSELSCIYKKNGRTRRLHLLVCLPTLEAVRHFTAALAGRGCNLRADGRPILGLEGKEVLRLALEADPRALVIPAHTWTPWFSVFGSESGFDSLEECFEELTPYIHAIETGLSSDPPMNWRLTKLDSVMLVSNSDAHGLDNLGREANVFDLDEPSYDALADVLRHRDRKRFLNTIEFFPEEGKYHVDGHRACEFFCQPEETVRRGGLCPKCGKPLTRGVLGRVHALADRPAGHRPPGAVPFRSIVPLAEAVADALGKTKASKAVFSLYKALIEKVGPEFDVLLDAEISEVAAAAGERMAEAVRRVRAGRITALPGYDGVFGCVKILDDAAPNEPPKQKTLL